MASTIIILGGGIIGLSCAYEAAKRGLKVSIIEPGAFGGQASGAAAGMLAPFSENTEQPDHFFQLCYSSLNLFPAWISEIESITGISTEWVQSGSIHVFQHEADLLPIQSRLQWHNEWGARSELVSQAQLRKLEPHITEDAIAGIYTPGESHVFAPKLAIALEAACSKLGIEMISQAGQLEDLKPSAVGGASIRMQNMRKARHADQVVICSGAWASQFEQYLGLSIPIHPIRGQICSYEMQEIEIRHIVFSSQAYWVGKKNDRLVCGASEDVAGFDTTTTERGIQRLVRSSAEWFPFLQDRAVAHQWAGLRPATRDGMPLIGTISGMPGIMMAAGHYRNGILLSPITAKLIGDLLEDKAVRLSLGAFAPSRFTVCL